MLQIILLHQGDSLVGQLLQNAPSRKRARVLGDDEQCSSPPLASGEKAAEGPSKRLNSELFVVGVCGSKSMEEEGGPLCSKPPQHSTLSNFSALLRCLFADPTADSALSAAASAVGVQHCRSLAMLTFSPFLGTAAFISSSSSSGALPDSVDAIALPVSVPVASQAARQHLQSFLHASPHLLLTFLSNLWSSYEPAASEAVDADVLTALEFCIIALLDPVDTVTAPCLVLVDAITMCSHAPSCYLSSLGASLVFRLFHAALQQQCSALLSLTLSVLPVVAGKLEASCGSGGGHALFYPALHDICCSTLPAVAQRELLRPETSPCPGCHRAPPPSPSLAGPVYRSLDRLVCLFHPTDAASVSTMAEARPACPVCVSPEPPMNSCVRLIEWRAVFSPLLDAGSSASADAFSQVVPVVARLILHSTTQHLKEQTTFCRSYFALLDHDNYAVRMAVAKNAHVSAMF